MANSNNRNICLFVVVFVVCVVVVCVVVVVVVVVVASLFILKLIFLPLVAFDFCRKYERKQEFKKLCENLHFHLQQVLTPKVQASTGTAAPLAISLNNPESLQVGWNE